MSSRGSLAREAAASERSHAGRRTPHAILSWLAAHQRTSAGLLFAALVVAYLWPVLIGGDILSPRSTLFQFPPWASTAPPDFPSFTSFFLGDVPMVLGLFGLQRRSTRRASGRGSTWRAVRAGPQPLKRGSRSRSRRRRPGPARDAPPH